MTDAENPSGFEIDGEVLEVPTLDSLDMNEAQILYDLSGVIIEDFIPAHPDATEEERAAVMALQGMKVRNPAFRRALVHVAYRRAHPNAEFDSIHEITGKANATDVTIAILMREDDDADPSTSSPKPLEPRSSTSETSESSSSGNPSGSDSDGQDVIPLRTGTGVLDMSSQGWPAPRSAP